MADLTQCTAIQLLGLYRSGEASPAEATQAEKALQEAAAAKVKFVKHDCL
jgi:hypothetical protein